VVAVREAVRINAGGGAVGSFGEDRFGNGGGTYATTHAIDTSGVANAAPAEVYQSDRGAAEFAYTLSGLKPGVAHTLRLHFAELWFDSSSVGARVFNVVINGTTVLENFDIVAVAGANKAVVREFNPVANVEGQIIVNFVTVVGGAKVNGVELIMPPAASGDALAQINCGGTHLGTFVADQYTSEGAWGSVSGGAFAPTENVVTTSGVENAAPAAVYQSQRWGNTFSYTLTGLTPTLTYTVRLHFAETYYALAGIRIFNVAINGTRIIENFDVYGVAGFNHAVVRDFQAIVPANGQIVVSFDSVSDNAILNGLELFAPVQAAPPGRSIGAGRHPVAAGCNAVAVAYLEQSTDSCALHLSRFKSAGQSLGSAQVAQAKVSTPDPGVAALPGDDFVVAWTDFDDDELGISLRKVVGGVAQGKTIVANEESLFSQSGSDIVFDGRELVVAWVDSRDPANGPDLRYRLFTPDLVPLTGDQVLAATGAVEDNVVLAGRNGHWAAAWRSGAQGMETIEVQSVSAHWTVGPFLPGATEDRPDLIFLDDTHLAVAFTTGTDPMSSGTANVSRLHAAVLDAAAPGQTTSFAIPPAQDPYSSSLAVGQTQPALTFLPGEMLVSWHSGPVPGDGRGEELWLRHVPYTVGSDGAVSLDPSHVEVPIVRTAVQRVGDQSTFRLLQTNASGGGLMAVWEDQARTFGSSEGAPDVAVEFMPEVAEPPPAVTTYPLSPDGKYYLVNVLKRNYPGPTVNATYSNDARLYAGQFPPEGVFDGHPFGYSWISPAANDADATVVLTVDMGQYFSVGAISSWFNAASAVPNTTQIRLATDTSHWTTVVPAGTPVVPFTTYEVDPPVMARFVELTQVGTGATPRINLNELMVFPSSQQSPAPTSEDGYDLGYLATTTVSSNMTSPSTLMPPVWPAGNAAAGPTGRDVNGFVDVDFRAQYPVTRLETCFLNPFNWLTGGRLDIAAIPELFQTLLDSGIGQPFGLTNICQVFSLPGQPMRYVRATDYAASGTGISPRTLSAITAFTTPKPLTTYYPLSADRKYFLVNSARRPTGQIEPTATVAYSNGGLPHPNPLLPNPANALDGSDSLAFYFTATSANFATATATYTVDLGQVQSLGAIRELYANGPPDTSSLRVAQSLAGPWTTLRSNMPITDSAATTSFDALSVRYIELTMKGMTTFGVVNLVELVTYPSATTADPAVSSSGKLDLSYLPGWSVTVDANMGQGGATRLNPVPGGAAYYVKTPAQGGTGDATATIDFGQPYSISEVRLFFYSNQRWLGGGRVDIDDGAGNWINVFDSGRGTALGRASDGLQAITFAPHLTRRLRVTGYFDPARPTGYLTNIEVY